MYSSNFIYLKCSDYRFKLATEVSNVENIRRYSYKELRIATEDFRAVNKIGEGGFGSVYKVMILSHLCYPFLI